MVNTRLGARRPGLQALCRPSALGFWGGLVLFPSLHIAFAAALTHGM